MIFVLRPCIFPGIVGRAHGTPIAVCTRMSPRSLVAVVVFLAASSALDASAGSPKKKDDGPTFDKSAAAAVLSSVDLAKCKAPNAKRGEGHVTVTFAPEGNASKAVVDKGPMLGSPVQRCIETRFKQAKVPSFKGAPVQVGKTFRFE
jgi:hypothetical protein